MKTISIREFHKQTAAVLQQVQKGRVFVLTYRGKPIARLEPITERTVTEDDPIYHLADVASPTAQPLTNAEIDQTVYGPGLPLPK